MAIVSPVVIQQIVLDNFAVDYAHVEIVDKLQLVAIYVPGVSKDVQIAINDFVMGYLPLGVRLDVHRSRSPCESNPYSVRVKESWGALEGKIVIREQDVDSKK